MSKISDFIRNNTRPFCTMVVVAAGSSTRMGEDKLMARICGAPVLAMTLTAIERCSAVDEIIVVTKSDRIAEIAKFCDEYSISKVTKVLCGGATRAESALAGISEADPKAKVIAIHDGARPLVTDKTITDVVHAAALYSAAAPALPVKDTVKITENGLAITSPDRNTLVAVQTPQAFNAELIKAALTDAVMKEITITDDCSAVEALGIPVHLVDGDERNIKITTPVDLIIAEALIKAVGEKI